MSCLATARWLTTEQIHRRFFKRRSIDAARKRLRKLADVGYLVQVRKDRMSSALFTVGPEGKRLLEREGHDAVALERRVPMQLEHLLGINDLRIAAEETGQLSYFFACWELGSLQWRYPVIPDAIAAFGAETFALEFDRGVEGLQFFTRTKMTVYQKGLAGFPLSAVLVVADRAPRTKALAAAIGRRYGNVLFATLDAIREQGLLAPIFVREADGPAEGLSSKSVVSRGEAEMCKV